MNIITKGVSLRQVISLFHWFLNEFIGSSEWEPMKKH